MGTITCPEVRPNLDNPLERARSRFEQAVYLAGQLAEAERSWAVLGRLLTVLEKEQDYKKLGFKDMPALIMEIEVRSGYCRASMYSFKKLYAEVETNGGDDVLGMRLGTAHVYRQLPAAVQRDPKVKSAAKKLKPKQFRESIAESHPEAHVEVKEEITLSLDGTFSPIFHEVVESIRTLEEDPTMSYERAIELMCIAWMNETWGEPEAGVTNIARARQIREMMGAKAASA